ncbi:uncharacterized protein B0P05DRAFT_556843 [Gilbertella persicaria]|uniref:Uncharacterized protein n=1 Tax=Rhizopus stolonifer TaxID=4846 RepID=A0A367IQ71_RHIST|nr:uncharacterized protein B0P05DRAFT_556843 [Gilbertella persicaria]KAI8061835.1 hypothetical protein B0P05DRAFT_556843 [Gilbertella persicaria]RCH79815.1 hypothetical protein CU098_004733 [Rhizopus stolonifer]
MSSPLLIATIALQGAAAGVSGELAVRSLFRKQDKLVQVRVGKLILGAFMALKSILFLTFHDNQSETCSGAGKVADLFYHIAMTAGNYVLLCRVQSVVPLEWRKRTQILHTILTVLRFIVGIVDVVLIKINIYSNGACDYEDQEFWGPVYTLYDTVLDIYVTISISGILINHIRTLKADRMRVNKLLYTSVIYHNIFRSVGITITSLISTIFIIMKNQEEIIMLIWPIIDTFLVILVGYDSDLTRAIRKLQSRRWRSASNMTSTVDLNALPPFRPSTKPALSQRHSDLEIVPQYYNTDIEAQARQADSISMEIRKLNGPNELVQKLSDKVAGFTNTITDNNSPTSFLVAGTTSHDTDKTRV